MNLVTINNIWLKCYLNFNKIVADGMRSTNELVVALNDFYFVLEKNNKRNYSFFRVILISLLLVFTSQTSLSSSVNSRMPAISEGIVVLNDFDFGFCSMTLDFTSNNFIPPCLSFVINIFDNILYIFYPQLNKV